MKRALLVEVDYRTGERAGDVDPRDGSLQSYGWQSLPEDDGDDVELRVVEDDRDLSEYEDVDGVTVLEGAETINDAIDTYFSTTYSTPDLNTILLWANNVGVDISEMPEDDPERAEWLAEKGMPQVKKRFKPKVEKVTGRVKMRKPERPGKSKGKGSQD